MVHEDTPSKLAGIHAGDWLVKLLAVAVIVSVCFRMEPEPKRFRATRPTGGALSVR